ncbi:atherin-like [Oenanthe melanoleuca]|uniref:atherin-like n=1 Tax=Oenanthe melanoleuca TaxID=2939378 RepID=UPI0024C1E745|nr:atherin-like [Oenanthe melanoleuca]
MKKKREREKGRERGPDSSAAPEPWPCLITDPAGGGGRPGLPCERAAAAGTAGPSRPPTAPTAPHGFHGLSQPLTAPHSPPRPSRPPRPPTASHGPSRALGAHFLVGTHTLRARLRLRCRHETPAAALDSGCAPGEPPPSLRTAASQPGPAQEAPPARLLPPALRAAALQGALPLSPGAAPTGLFSVLKEQQLN